MIDFHHNRKKVYFCFPCLGISPLFSGKAEIDFLPVMVKVYHCFLRLSTKYFTWLTIVFIPASNEPSIHASMDIWRLPRGSNTPLLAAGYLIQLMHAYTTMAPRPSLLMCISSTIVVSFLSWSSLLATISSMEYSRLT